MGKPEVFKIGRGLANFGISDHYAILGLPLTADANQIRKKYLKLAKVLHPDIYGRTLEEKELTTQYLSKMVNPAYQTLSNDRSRGEYLATLRLFVQGQKQKNESLEFTAAIAQKLYKMPHEITYTKYVEEIAPIQYESLDKILEHTGDLSELNLVYLFTQQSLSFASSIPQAPPATSAATSPANNAAAPPPPKPPAQSPALRNLNMAELFINKKQWTDALKELNAAEKLDPNNAKIFGLKGLVQMNQNMAAMAKASFQKALKLDPKEPTALKYINQANAATQPPKQPEKKGGGGLFGWGKK